MPDQQAKDAIDLLFGLGWDRARILSYLSADSPETAEAARDRITADLAIKLWELAMAGNVSAVREFRRLLEAMAPEPEAPEEERPVRRHPIGKKEMALIEARAPDLGTPMGELMARRAQGELSN